jgi:protein phosphatase methylesterase 1
LHGAGHSAFSFAALAKLLKTEDTCASFDFRGHGENTQSDPLVMTPENLIQDTILVVKFLAELYPE